MPLPAWSLLGTNLALVIAVLSLAALPSFRSKDPSYIDGLWGLGFVVIAGSSFLQTEGDRTRKTLLLALTVLWGVRLSAHLFTRWRAQGPDPRYQRMYGENASNSTLWLKVFVTQAVVLTLVALPVQLGQVYDGSLTILNVLGAVLALVGIAIEAVADAQLKRFKADAGNHGTVLDRGLWRWSRHPNYFGEATTWWGIGLLAWHNGPTTLGLLGPALITYFLLTRSGIGPLEAQLSVTKPQYADYIKRTSAFLPRPPRSA